MNGGIKGILGLVLWLAAGFAVTECATLALSVWIKREARVGHVDADQIVATVPATD